MITQVFSRSELECETQLDIQISSRIYQKLCKKYTIKYNSVIFYYQNSIRAVKCGDNFYEIQNKDCFLKQNVLRFFNNTVPYYFSRRRSREMQIMKPPDTNLIIATCYRKIIFYEKNKYGCNNIRVSLDKVAYREKGLPVNLYRIRLEIEYEPHIPSLEMDNVIDWLFGHFSEYWTTVPSELSIKEMLLCPSRPFHYFHQNNIKEPYNYIRKFDGYRAKVTFKTYNEISYGLYVDDLGNIGQVECSELNIFKNVIFQLEMLQNAVILTDILGTYFFNNLYVPTFQTVFDLFEKLSSTSSFMKSTVGNHSVKYPVYFQSPKLQVPDNLQTDGVILISDQKLFKVKALTFDARYKKKCFYLDDHASSLHQCEETLEEEGIYELCLSIEASEFKFKHIRQRFDRICTDKYEKYLLIKQDLTLMQSI